MSTDVFLGLPFNIASYALLLNIICEITKCVPGELIFNGGDCHIYKNHLSQASQLLEREPRELPVLEIQKSISSLNDLKSLTPKDFQLKGYNPHGRLKAPMAV